MKIHKVLQLNILIKKGEEALSCLYPDREAREIVLSLLESLVGTKRYTHIVEPEYIVADADVAKVNVALSRLVDGEPLQYVLGHAWFYGRCFNVTPDVLIPRPETEVLCKICLEEMAKRGLQSKDVKVLDLCTGSGCIAWTMALEMPSVQVFAGDISDGALKVASSQAFSDEMKLIGAVAPKFFKTDVLKDNISLDIPFDGMFDVILSNPPYVKDSEKSQMRKNVLDFEPSLALFVPDDDALKFYSAVARHAARHLSSNGFGIVEINEALGPETASVFVGVGFKNSQVLEDFSGKSRFVFFSR